MSPVSAAPDPRLAPAPDSSGERRLGLGRLAGLLFALAALLGLAAEALGFGRPLGAGALVPAALALVAALACLLAAWDRLPPVALHAPAALASLLLAGAIAAAGHAGAVLAPFGFLVVAWVANAFRSRRAIAAHVALVAAAVSAAVLAGGAGRAEAAGTVLGVLTLAGVAAVIAGLRERLEAGQRALRELALRDPLTGVGNLRALQERLAYELVRHARHGRELTVVVLDLDRFKEVNDTLGHPAGDALLREVAATLRETVRSQDTVVRQGGDEFALLVPETDARDAHALAVRIARALHRHEVLGLDDGGRRVSTALGWAVFPHDGRTSEDLLGVADARQLVHKRRRRLTPVPPPAAAVG